MLNQFFSNSVFLLIPVILGKVNSFFDQNIILQQNSSKIPEILKSSAFFMKDIQISFQFLSYFWEKHMTSVLCKF